MQNSGDDLQQRAFAASVLSDDTERFAAPYFEINLVERPEIAMPRNAIERQQLLQPV
jgi:hypothetical protein